MVDCQIFDAVNPGLKVFPPDGGAVVERVNVHLLTSGGDTHNSAFVGLADFNPLNKAAGVITLPESGFIRVPDIARKFERTVVTVIGRIEREGHQARHHTLVGLRWMSGDGEREIRITIPVQVGQFDAGLVDDGLHWGRAEISGERGAG